MVQVRVAGVAIDVRGQHVVLLKPIHEEPGEGLVLPIWIGSAESTSILIAIEGATPPRPLGHDLMGMLLDATGSAAQRVEVTRIDDGTYYAELTVQTPDDLVVFDCRPSDAIALGSRLDVPLFVAAGVPESSGVPDDFTADDDDENDDERVEEFKRFLDEVDPDDFQG